MKLYTRFACCCMATILMSSCIVSKKKYDAAMLNASQEHAENDRLKNQIAGLDEDVNKKSREIHQQKNNIETLNGRIATLQDSISTEQASINDLNNKINDLGNKNQISAQQLSSTKAQIAEQRRRLEQLQSFVDAQQKATEALRKKIADALEGFNSSELTISRKNGKVYISMQEGLLFPSGSAEVNPKGKEALSKVATVLNSNADINIDVEGHTDSLPIHNRVFADNWSLSTARATSIAHVLIDEYHVSPAKLVASGRSSYDPVATNATPEGRAANRRTEIILEPKLDELMQLLNGGPGK
jgi:chemotaxis protein MotB